MQQGPPRRRRPRPLPDAPVQGLLERSKELAKGWLIALVEELPLEDAGRIQMAELASDAPALCEWIALALADDAALARLAPGGPDEGIAARVGRVAGVTSPDAVSGVVEALRAVIWVELREAFADPSQEQLFELAERLAMAVELIRCAALRVASPPQASEELPVVHTEEGAGGVWLQLLAASVARANREGTGLALLLVELDDVDRLLAISSPEESAAGLAAFEAAVWATAGEHDGEVLSEEGRAWVIVPGLARTPARTLASRLGSAIGAADRWRGAPLKASVGIALLGKDGDDAQSLLAAAEEARFAAQASGVSPAG